MPCLQKHFTLFSLNIIVLDIKECASLTNVFLRNPFLVFNDGKSKKIFQTKGNDTAKLKAFKQLEVGLGSSELVILI